MNRNFFGVALTLQIGRVVSRQKSYSRHSLALEHVRNPRTSCRSLRSFQTLLNPLCKVEPGRGRWVVWLRVVVVCSSGSSDSGEVQPGVCMLVRGQSRGGRRLFLRKGSKACCPLAFSVCRESQATIGCAQRLAGICGGWWWRIVAGPRCSRQWRSELALPLSQIGIPPLLLGR